MHNLKNIDMIGKKILIENSSDSTKSKISGLVIFESKNVIILRTENKKVVNVKKNEILKIKEF